MPASPAVRSHHRAVAEERSQRCLPLYRNGSHKFAIRRDCNWCHDEDDDALAGAQGLQREEVPRGGRRERHRRRHQLHHGVPLRAARGRRPPELQVHEEATEEEIEFAKNSDDDYLITSGCEVQSVPYDSRVRKPKAVSRSRVG